MKDLLFRIIDTIINSSVFIIVVSLLADIVCALIGVAIGIPIAKLILSML